MEIEKLIQEGWNLTDITDDAKLSEEYDRWCRKVKEFLKREGFSKENLREIQVKMQYTANEFSKDETRKSIIKAVKDTVCYLEETDMNTEKEISKEAGIMLIDQILNNFYLYYRTMYQSPIHKKGTLTTENLKKIQIGNEYDLQRMLYSLLLPVFPMFRQEVNSDNGYGGLRADIYLEEYNLVIETKCTRGNMNEKKLAEELGADGFHYQADMVFFFVYDKNNIIKNPEAFKAAFAREQKKDGKTIKVIILQPVEL